MKILIINALSALRGGGQTYLINLLREFNQIDTNCQIILLTNQKNTNLFKQFQSDSIIIEEAGFASKNIVFRVLWEIFILPFF